MVYELNTFNCSTYFLTVALDSIVSFGTLCFAMMLIIKTQITLDYDGPAHLPRFLCSLIRYGSVTES